MGTAMDGNYTAPLYAGAGGCDVCRGSYVGDVSYSYNSGTLTVTYTLFVGFLLDSVHIHVGGPESTDRVPKRGENPTVAPGAYGCGTEKKNSCTVTESSNGTFTAVFMNVSDPFYIIAHAVVGGSDTAYNDNPGCN